MKIKGKNKLNQNNYNDITIRGDIDEYYVTVTGGTYYPSVKQENPIINDNSTIEDIIYYFLDNNNISYVTRKDDINVLIISNRVKNLLLHNVNDLSLDIRNRIVEKYNQDKYKYVCSITDVDKVIFSYKDYSEYRYLKADKSNKKEPISVNSFNNEDESKLYISLSNSGILKEADEKFLLDYVNTLINNTLNKIKVNLIYSVSHYKKTGKDRYDYKLIIDKKEIIIPEKQYIEYFKNIINEHNEKIEDNKKLQLTMFDK